MAATKVDFRIGPRNPTRYADFSASNPTWGSAIARMGNAYVKAHNRRKDAEADRQLQTKQAQKRGAWAQEIGEGATVREIAMRDPSIIGDSAFLGFLDKTQKPKGYEDILDDQGRPIAQRGPQGRTYAHPLAPEPEGPAAETWEDVASPFGHGGFGQRNTVTGKIAGYQSAPSPSTAPQRRIVKGPDGLSYYTDTQERVLPNVAAPTPESDAPEPAKFEHVRALAGDWDDATKPVRDLARQRDLMQIGLEKA